MRRLTRGKAQRITVAEREKQAAILRAEGDRQLAGAQRPARPEWLPTART